MGTEHDTDHSLHSTPFAVNLLLTFVLSSVALAKGEASGGVGSFPSVQIPSLPGISRIIAASLLPFGQPVALRAALPNNHSAHRQPCLA